MQKYLYSITLNFFVPTSVVEKLRKVKVSGSIGYDWLNSPFAHCTVKAIYFGMKHPSPKEIETWIQASRKILSHQEPFQVTVKGITRFPTAIVADVHSETLRKLHRQLGRVLPSSQPEFENQNYRPHVSIVMTAGEVSAIAPKTKAFGTFKVDRLQLMVWNMDNSEKPRTLVEFKLKKINRN